MKRFLANLSRCWEQFLNLFFFYRFLSFNGIEASFIKNIHSHKSLLLVAKLMWLLKMSKPKRMPLPSCTYIYSLCHFKKRKLSCPTRKLPLKFNVSLGRVTLWSLTTGESDAGPQAPPMALHAQGREAQQSRS